MVLLLGLSLSKVVFKRKGHMNIATLKTDQPLVTDLEVAWAWDDTITPFLTELRRLLISKNPANTRKFADLGFSLAQAIMKSGVSENDTNAFFNHIFEDLLP